MVDQLRPPRLLAGTVMTLLSLAVSSTVSAASEDVVASDAEQLKFEIRQLQLINERQAKALQELEQRLYLLENSGSTGIQQQAKEARVAEQSQTSEPVKKAADPSSSVENILQEEHALFDDNFTLEVGFNYSHYDRKDLVLEGFLALDAIFLGDISVDDIAADIFTVDLTGRYNVTDRWQIGATLPFVYRQTNFQRNVNVGVEASVDEADLGDITLSSAYQLYQESDSWPDIVWNLSVKAPTGSHPYGTTLETVERTRDGDTDIITFPSELPTGNGLWSISNSLSFVKTTDPAILFANIGYTHNLEGSFDDIGAAVGDQPGDVRLGDSLYYGIGMAFALNEKMSLSLSLSQRLTQKSETRNDGQPWEKAIGSDGNSASFTIGGTYAINSNMSVSTSLGIGLTPDAPDFSLGVKFPYRL